MTAPLARVRLSYGDQAPPGGAAAVWAAPDTGCATLSASVRAVVRGEKIVWSTGASSRRPRAMRRRASSSRPRARVQRLDPRPVGWRAHGVLGALLGAAGGAGTGDPAPPVLPAVPAARRDRDEVEVPAPVEGQHRVGEAGRRVVHLGGMPPGGHGRVIHGLPGACRLDPLALGHRCDAAECTTRVPRSRSPAPTAAGTGQRTRCSRTWASTFLSARAPRSSSRSSLTWVSRGRGTAPALPRPSPAPRPQLAGGRGIGSLHALARGAVPRCRQLLEGIVLVGLVLDGTAVPG